MAVATVDEYLSALEKSKLLASEQLVKAQSLASGSSDPKTLAQSLARENLVSRWQAGTLLALGQRAQLRLGKYKLIERLGKGGMGTVFLAQHVTMNRRVALKIVPRTIAQDRTLLDQFFAEARAIAALDHPNIVQAYSVDNEMDRYFIVMEFVDGRDLQRVVETEGPLDFDRATDYIRQAAEGLAHAHDRNLVHCDVKPSNLLVNQQGVIKILDLGLARLNQGDEGQQGSGPTAFGTVDYMAPEQGLGAADFDHRADIYSLGCTLYFLLSGHPPFPEGTLAQRIVRHQTQEPRDILLERPNTPPRLVEACKRMMAKQPEDRYQSMPEVIAALIPPSAAAAPPVNASLAVKLLDEGPIEPPPDDWFGALAAGPSHAANGSAGTSAPAATATRAATVHADGRPSSRSRNGRPIKAAAPAGLLGVFRTKLRWFNTPKRKILGAAGGTVTLAAAVGLAALPFVLRQPAPKVDDVAHSSPPAHAAAKPKPIEEEVVRIPDLASETKDAEPHPAEKPPQPVVKNGPKPRRGHVKPAPEEVAVNIPPAPAVKRPSPPSPKAAEPNRQTAKPPEIKPQESKPPEVAKPVVLDELLSAVDVPLPNKEMGATASLGKVDLSAKNDLDLQLLGGDTIAKGNPKFSVQKTDGSATEWSVLMAERNKEGTAIARIRSEEGELKFQWTPEAKDKASLVRFCMLEFRSGAKTHYTALTAPKTVPPLVLETESGMRPQRLNRDFALPDASVLRLQLLPVEGGGPKPEIRVAEKSRASRNLHGKPQPAAPASTDSFSPQGGGLVMFTKDKARIGFAIAFSPRDRELSVTTKAAAELNGGPPLSASAIRSMQANSRLILANKDGKNGWKPTDEQVKAAGEADAQLKSLDALAGEVNHTALPYRIYAIVGEADDDPAHRVVIYENAQGGAPNAAKPPEKPQRPRGHGRR